MPRKIIGRWPGRKSMELIITPAGNGQVYVSLDEVWGGGSRVSGRTGIFKESDFKDFSLDMAERQELERLRRFERDVTTAVVGNEEKKK